MLNLILYTYLKKIVFISDATYNLNQNHT